MSKKTAMQMAISHYKKLSELGSNQAYVVYKFLEENFLEVEKQQIFDAFEYGDYNIDLPDGSWEQKFKSPEHYYEETYGGKNDVNEKYGELINKAYSDYRESFKDSIVEPYTKELFIDKCKHNIEYSIRWGLGIEERELSLRERGDIFKITYPDKSVDDFAPSGMEVQSLSHQLNTRYNNAKIPTKLITLTYNNERVEIYE
jgi:hypothetical protein